MGSSADKGRLRHNPRHNESASTLSFLHQLASARPRPVKSQRSDLFREQLEAWGIPLDDAEGMATKERLEKTRPVLSTKAQILLFLTAEEITEAEKAKNAYNLKANRDRYTALCKNAIAAARLVKNIREMFPPPWIGVHSRIGTLLAGLAPFIEGTFSATMHIGKDLSRMKAHAMIQTAKRHGAKEKSRMHYELIADLIWLASGKNFRISERSVRRYLTESSRSEPMWPYWKRNWNLLQYALRFSPSPKVSGKLLIPRGPSTRASKAGERPPKPPRPVPRAASKGQRKAIEAFTEVARLYLEAPLSSPVRVAKAAQKRS